eukprot:Gb_38026 [translate_table: standard]
MGRYSNVSSVSKRRKGSAAAASEHWLVPHMKRYYEPNKPAILAVGLVLFPICIRLLLPSVEISSFIMLPMKESLPQVWNVMQSWLTPSMLFLVLNLVIGTIAVTSGRGPNKDKKKSTGHIQWNAFEKHEEWIQEKTEEDEEDEEEEEWPIKPPLVEPPNPVVSRKPRHFSPLIERPKPAFSGKTHEFPPLVEPPNPNPVFSPQNHHFSPAVERTNRVFSRRTRHFSHVSRNKTEMPTSIKVVEAACTEDLTNSMEEEDIASPDSPSTEEFNAKAADFIYKFKQQLVLQRMQSYKERRGK